MGTSFGSRRLLALAFVVLSSLVSAQDWKREGGITSRQYKTEIREGNQVAATEFFTLEYSVSTWLEELSGQAGYLLQCANICGNNLEVAQNLCNFKCDDRCTVPHEQTVEGSYEPDRAAMAAATSAANGLAAQGGGTASPSDWSHRVSQSLAQLRREAKKKKTFQMPHAESCSMRFWVVGTKRFAFHVKGTMKKVGFTMRRGVRTPINETVGNHEQVVAHANIVQDDPLEQSHETFCECAPELFDDAYFQRLFDLIDEAYEKYGIDPAQAEAATCPPTGVIIKDEEGKRVDPKDCPYTVTPTDMNRCTVEFANKTGKDCEIVIPTGTRFVCADDRTQDMYSTVRTVGLALKWSTTTISVSLTPSISVEGLGVRWMCLEMTKKEPSPGSKYEIQPQHDDTLVRLGAITNASRFRGPHDQARTWIYTDKAPMDEINKRLSPGVTAGRYATLLWEVATKGGVDVASKQYVKCLEPKLLSGIALDDRATNWLVSTLAETKPKDLAAYVSKNASALAGLMKSDPEFGPGQVVAMISAMLNQEDASVRMASVKVLQAVPADMRAPFAAMGGLEGLRSLLISSNEAEIAAAVDLFLLYPLDSTKDILGASWEQLPTDALKEKAKKHLGIVE